MDEKMINGLAFQMDMAAVPMKDILDLTGKVAIVTGGCTGLGFAVANRLGEAGAKVVISSRNAERGAAAQEYLRGKG